MYPFCSFPSRDLLSLVFTIASARVYVCVCLLCWWQYTQSTYSDCMGAVAVTQAKAMAEWTNIVKLMVMLALVCTMRSVDHTTTFIIRNGISLCVCSFCLCVCVAVGIVERYVCGVCVLSAPCLCMTLCILNDMIDVILAAKNLFHPDQVRAHNFFFFFVTSPLPPIFISYSSYIPIHRIQWCTRSLFPVNVLPPLSASIPMDQKATASKISTMEANIKCTNAAGEQANAS